MADPVGQIVDSIAVYEDIVMLREPKYITFDMLRALSRFDIGWAFTRIMGKIGTTMRHRFTLNGVSIEENIEDIGLWPANSYCITISVDSGNLNMVVDGKSRLVNVLNTIVREIVKHEMHSR